MDFKVDWFAFTVPLPSPVATGGAEIQDFIQQAVCLLAPSLTEPITGGHAWQINNGRGFYQWVMHYPDHKLTLQWGDVNAHVHVELSGQTCAYMRDRGLLKNILEEVGTRASRVDIAADIETDTVPLVFTDNKEGKSFASGGHIFSKDGETAYVGSKKGERFARVYRYHEPHPRAKYLRVEVVMKGSYAKATVQRILEVGYVQAGIDANKPYGWTHTCWDTGMATADKIKAPRSSIGEASTLRWLVDACFPAMVRLHSEGNIDIRQLVQEHLLSKLTK